MNGQMMNYETYIKSMENMMEPVTPDKLPKIKIDFRGMLKYAKSLGKTVPELTDDEKAMFVDGGLKNLKIVMKWKKII